MNFNGDYGKLVSDEIKIFVYNNEKIPHCHIIFKNNMQEVCVRLDKSEYFYHENRNKFTNSEKEKFFKFINEKDNFGTIRWNWAGSTWEGFAQNNDLMKRIDIQNIPDYNLLET